MAAQYYKINYKSDFVLTINSDAGWAVPFCIKFWTGMPSHGYFAGFDGENYVNCRVGETPTQLLVMFDDHHMPIGLLRMQIAYHTTIEEFPDRKFDEVTNPTNVTVDIDGTEYQVMLDFTGETGADIDFSMPSSGVMSVNGKIGYVTLNAEDVGAQPTIEDLSTIRSGAAAGATAVQPATLQEGLATKQDVISDLATIRSGAAAGATAVQPAGLTPIQTALQTIEAVIPSAASAQNQLADKNFVNSSISTNTANFVGTFETLAELQAVQNPTNNDYGFVIETDSQGNEYYDRYKYVAASQQWLFEYKVESTPFTAAQWAAIQSGITSALVTKLNALPTAQQLSNQLAAKQDTISDLSTIRSGAAAGATAVQPAAMNTALAAKQDTISDLATIRSGAAAGATAVQPAAMNTALAAKQDTLTFDNAPTANSNNPVKSSGIKTALDAKQDTISTVNVTVDNNTGTPSGTASVSGSTLSLSFQNLKGATGATGATGPQGQRGERGLPGESGVTGDVSGFTVIQTIDPSATYGATDIAGAATVQATNAELTELEGEVNGITYQVGVNLTAENGRVTSTGTFAGGSSFKHITLNVDEGDIINFTPCGSGLYYPSYGFAFYDANDVFMFANVDATLVGSEQTIKVPAGAKYFRAGFSNADANNATYNTFKLTKGTNLLNIKADEIYDNLLAVSCDYGFVYSAAQSVTSFTKLQDGRVTRIDYTSQVTNNAVTISRLRMSEVPTGTKYVCFGFKSDIDMTGSIFISKRHNDWTTNNLITSITSFIISKDNGLVVPCEIDTLKAAGLEDIFVIFRKDSTEENTSLYCGVFYKTLAHLIREEKSSGGDTPTPTPSADDGVKTYIAGQDLTTAEGRIDASGAAVGGSTFAHITLEVTGGDVVKFTPSLTGIGTAAYGWAFYDENDTVLFVNTDVTTVNIEQSVIVPNGAKYFRFGGSLSTLTSSPYNVFTLISKTQVVQQSERQIYNNLLAISSSYSSVYSSATSVTSVEKLEENRITRLKYTTPVSNNAVAFSKLVVSEAPSGTKKVMLSFLPTINMTVNVFISKRKDNWTGSNIVTSNLNLGLSNGKNNIISFNYETIKAAGEDGLFLIVVKTSTETNCTLDCAAWFETIAEELKEKDTSEDYSQKTWNAIGDSITAQGFYITAVRRLLPIQTVNGGLTSSTIAINDTYMSGQSIVERVTSGQYAAADVWSVMGGLNDALYNSPLGALAPIGSTYDKTTVYGALQAIVEYIMQTERPRLILLTPAHSTRDNYDTSQHPTTMAAIRQAIIDVGALYGVPVCDVWAEGGINLYNAQRATNPTTSDGVHWNDLGSEMAAPVIARKLKEVLV